MAKHTIVTCDLHGDQTTPGSATTFAFQGRTYEVDLCDTHRGELKDSLERYIAAAHTAANGARSTTPQRRRASRNGAGGRNAEIRAWAREQGHEISGRGRVPASVVAAYDEAHAKGRRRAKKQ